MSSDLESRTALVTGASRGIGAAIARRLASDGAHVLLAARTESELAALVGEIESAGGSATPMVVDITDREASAAAVEAALASHGAIDILVNNAGGNVRKAADAYRLEEWDALLELGLTAPFHLSRLCGVGMRANGFGRIINIGSVAGLTALPTGAPYAVAKAGLVQLTKVLAREWGAQGVTVNLIAPWYVPTPLTEPVLSDEKYKHAILACTPSGRLGTSDEIAAAVRFLAGGEAGWINGAVLPLDGGFSAASFFPPDD